MIGMSRAVVKIGKRRYSHSHSHNTGDCKGEKTFAEFLHDVFLHSERNLRLVGCGADIQNACAPAFRRDFAGCTVSLLLAPTLARASKDFK